MPARILPSRTGAAFGAEVTTESDGALVILSNDGHGYRSAHRDAAATHFDHVTLWCMNRSTWINANGVRVVMTRWHTDAHRRTPISNTPTAETTAPCPRCNGRGWYIRYSRDGDTRETCTHGVAVTP